MSSLALRGIWLALEAWASAPPAMFVLENVPRILSRGRHWLDQVTGLLRGYGYAVRETTHDCGELGGLAQRRRRFLLVARQVEQVPEVLYEPRRLPLRPMAAVLEQLPVPLPGSGEGGPMHALPKLSSLNWLRLALIPAGGDWRDLPEKVTLHCTPRSTVLGVGRWSEPSATVIGCSRHDNGTYSLADPRVTCKRREGSMGVTPWNSPSTTVIAAGIVQNGPWQVADPRLEHAPRRGGHEVHGWAEPSHTIIGDARVCKGASVADPRRVSINGELDLANPQPTYIIIRAADGTWHRPLTTLELAALQGFPTRHRGEWLVLDGASHKAWRQRIGNAVPPPAAEAIARECRKTLEAARAGRLHFGSTPTWVSGEQWS
jgi:site-specific DNA-cytosine methylase